MKCPHCTNDLIGKPIGCVEHGLLVDIAAKADSLSLSLPDDYKSHPVFDGGVGAGQGHERFVTIEEFQAELKKQGTTVSAELGLARARRVRRVRVEEAEESVLRFLPKDFVWVYEQLLDRAFGERALGSGIGMGTDPEVQKATGKKENQMGRLKSEDPVRSLTAGSGKKGFGKTVIRSEQAISQRRKLDKKLRRLTREAKAWLDGADSVEAGRVCAGKCKRIGEADWNYCANCGGPMREADA